MRRIYKGKLIHVDTFFVEYTYGTRGECEQSPVGKSQIIPGIESMPQSRQAVRQNSGVIVNPFVDNGPQPPIGADIPTFDALFQARSELKAKIYFIY